MGTHDSGDDNIAQHGGHNPNNRLTETCSLCFLCTLIFFVLVGGNPAFIKSVHTTVQCESTSYKSYSKDNGVLGFMR